MRFNYKHQWWGETVKGAKKTIMYAKNLGLKIMLKPHVWVSGEGWPGEYNLQSEKEWSKWEKTYRQYIITYAKIADSMNVEMLCIGTEYKIAVKKRPKFWDKLIKEIRKIYDGKLTYAANWDNYKNVTFWDKLDYIGIDAYWPLSRKKTPSKETLIQAWQKPAQNIKAMHNKYNKKIIFTEYGYKNLDYGASSHWKLNSNNHKSNMKTQENAYHALFKVFWNKPWFAGGFLWKWHASHKKAGGKNNTQFTPQNKKAEKVVRKWYH